MLLKGFNSYLENIFEKTNTGKKLSFVVSDFNLLFRLQCKIRNSTIKILHMFAFL